MSHVIKAIKQALSSHKHALQAEENGTGGATDTWRRRKTTTTGRKQQE